MDEEEQVKKQLIKNMILNLITFSIIFYILGIVIYSKFSNFVYNSADNELQNAVIQLEDSQRNGEILPRVIEEERLNIREQSPRLVFIQRDSDGNIKEIEENEYLNEVFNDVYFDRTQINHIYEITIDNQYKYRGINYQLEDGEYTQILINVNGEEDIIERFTTTLVIVLVISVILIIIASYVLSKKTLKPIISSWKKQSEFVQDASHELRTPLAIIQAKQELLLEKPNSTILDNAEDINITLKETKRLTKLIKELMELARNDSKEINLKKQKIDLDKEIKETVEMYQETAKSQGKNLINQLEFGQEIEIDLNKLKELLIILLDNSIKYTEKKDTITVKTYKKEGKCFIEVIDTGIGISKEAKEHVFERFYREEKSRVREKGGTGLGLSIAYNIVKLHKGTIRIDKNYEDGTRMIIRLPIS